MPQREFDVVLYGASGFTGRQTVEYFAAHAPEDLRWAIAGRNREKLEVIKTQTQGAADAAVLVAESHEQAAIDTIVSRTRVLLTTAGPFARYGSGIVDACARFQTHYVDITGETPWVRDLIDRHHDRAAADGTRLIPFCGFDSVPSDLGAYLMVRHIQRHLGAECSEVHAYFQMMGGLNGGTLATAYHLAESGQAARTRDVFLLDPPFLHSEEDRRRNADPAGPEYDREIGAWRGPFVMGAINTRVVRRSRALFDSYGESYGPEFRYQEYQKFGGPLGMISAAGTSAGLALFETTLNSPLRMLLKSALPQPGEGPSEKTMNEGWFRCELIGRTAEGRFVRGVIRDQGDPGNRATVKFLCESALCLAIDSNRLPGGPHRGGLLTPATGLGDVLAERLRNRGMTIAMSVSSGHGE